MTKAEKTLEILRSIGRILPNLPVSAALEQADQLIEAVEGIENTDTQAAVIMDELFADLTEKQSEVLGIIKTFHAQGDARVATADIAEAMDTTPQNIAGTPAKLVDCGLIKKKKSGRNVFFCVAGAA